MRRRIVLVPVLGLLLAGLGCKHIAGRNDCQWSPEDSVLPGPTPPYVAVPATEPNYSIQLPTPGVKAGTVKAPDPTPMEKTPEKLPDAKSGGGKDKNF